MSNHTPLRPNSAAVYSTGPAAALYVLGLRRPVFIMDWLSRNLSHRMIKCQLLMHG